MLGTMGWEDTDSTTDITNTDLSDHKNQSNKKPFSKSRGHKSKSIDHYKKESSSKFIIRAVLTKRIREA